MTLLFSKIQARSNLKIIKEIIYLSYDADLKDSSDQVQQEGSPGGGADQYGQHPQHGDAHQPRVGHQPGGVHQPGRVHQPGGVHQAVGIHQHGVSQQQHELIMARKSKDVNRSVICINCLGL